MKRRERDSGAALLLMLRIVGGFLAAGLFLFLHVWWPIQAERNLLLLKRAEGQIFQKKSELNTLRERYAAATALPVLDQWAKRHGSWRPPQASNVIALRR